MHSCQLAARVEAVQRPVAGVDRQLLSARPFFLVNSVDNVKPLLISRGSSLPFLLVLLGVMGGVLAFGFVGIFIGQTLLAVGFSLLRKWTSAKSTTTG